MMEQALSIAGTKCLLEGNATPFYALLERRLSSFFTFSACADLSLELIVAHGRSDGSGTGRFTLNEATLALKGPMFEGRYDRLDRRGWLRQPPSRWIFDRFLSAVYAMELPMRGGLLLHAAGIQRDSAAYCFFGPSGSGKTTMARRHSRGVLSDEVVAIRLETSGPVAYGTPWRGRNLSAPLRGLFRLSRQGTSAIRPLSPGTAARELLSNLFLPVPDRRLTETVLEAIERLVRAVPVFELSVLRGRPFWPLIDQALTN
jgi:hypothetical protein